MLGSSLMALGTDGPDVKPGFGDPAAIGHLLLERFLLAVRGLLDPPAAAAVGAVVLAGRQRSAGSLEDSAKRVEVVTARGRMSVEWYIVLSRCCSRSARSAS